MVASPSVVSAGSRAASQAIPFAPNSLLPQCSEQSLPARLPPAVLLPVIGHPAPFSLAVFFSALSQIVLHPEHSSTLILRTDILEEQSLLDVPDGQLGGSARDETDAFRFVRRRLLPKQSKRDAALEQEVIFGRTSDEGGWVEYRCLGVDSASDMPYYHPPVRRLRYAYRQTDEGPSLCLSVVLFDETAVDERSKLYRTCLHLLHALVKHGVGHIAGYRKKVLHDVLVERDEFQDLYRELKDKYHELESRVLSSTSTGEDVKRHVWKDVAIASFLLLLWKGMYSAIADAPSHERRSWGRPARFVDIGCGNGLLVHILASEGCAGIGLELRPRKTWDVLPIKTRAYLRQSPIDPVALVQREGGPFDEDTFLIGNHADELTPWIPILAALTPGGAFVNIPCCLHTLTSKFTSSSIRLSPAVIPPGRAQRNVEDRIGQLKGGRFGAYLIWLAGLGWECGWEFESEALRIPSTRNWAIVGRKRTPVTAAQAAAVRARVLNIVEGVRLGQGFQVRQKVEGQQPKAVHGDGSDADREGLGVKSAQAEETKG